MNDYKDMGFPSKTLWRDCVIGENTILTNVDETTDFSGVPTDEQWQELINNCTWDLSDKEWITFISRINNNTIRIPRPKKKGWNREEFWTSSESFYLPYEYKCYEINAMKKVIHHGAISMLCTNKYYLCNITKHPEDYGKKFNENPARNPDIPMGDWAWNYDVNDIEN